LLSGVAKRNFREAIKIGILNLPKEEFYKEILKKFLFLSGELSASECIDAIIKRVGVGFFGKYEEIFILVLNIIAGMAPAYEVEDGIKSLISSHNFKHTLAPVAFITLCRSNPKKFHHHIKLLRSSFAKLHKDKNHLEKAYITARRFAEVVPVNIIAKNIAQLEVAPFLPYEETDMWLIEGLFKGKEAPLQLKIGNEIFIARKENKIWFRVEIPFYKEDFIKVIKEIDVYNDISSLINLMKSFFTDQITSAVETKSTALREILKVPTLQVNESFERLTEKISTMIGNLQNNIIPFYSPRRDYEQIRRESYTTH